jgi:hypothetical protein
MSLSRLLTGLLLALLLAACGDDKPSRPSVPEPPPMPGETPPGAEAAAGGVLDPAWWDRHPAVRILLYGGQRGKLKPCGCSSPQMGGLARLAAVLHQLRREAARGGTKVAALGAGWSLKGHLEAQEEAKADYLRAVYESLGFSAALLGETDLLVPAMCQARAKDGLGVPRPPLNLVLTESNPAFGVPPIARFSVGDLPVRAFSVVDPDRADLLQEGGFAQAVPSLASAFENLRPAPAVLWLASSDLGNAGMRDTLAAALERLGPAVIVDVAPHGFGVRKADHVPLGVGHPPLVVELDEHGKAVGVLDMERGPDGKGWKASYRLIELVPRWEHYGGTPLKEVDDLDGVYRKMVKARHYLAEFPREQDEGASYVGSSACARCHAAIYKDWKTTPHAVALQTLAHVDYDWDPECVRCHVVGWERNPSQPWAWTLHDSGFRTPDKTPFLGGVGCENCHGPGSEHVAHPWDKSLFADEKAGEDEAGNGGAKPGVAPPPNRARPAKRTCVRCHDPENSHGFNEGYETRYRPVIDHHKVPRDLRTVVPK